MSVIRYPPRIPKEAANTVYSGNSKRLNSEQSLISEHFCIGDTGRFFYNIHCT